MNCETDCQLTKVARCSHKYPFYFTDIDCNCSDEEGRVLNYCATHKSYVLTSRYMSVFSEKEHSAERIYDPKNYDFTQFEKRAPAFIENVRVKLGPLPLSKDKLAPSSKYSTFNEHILVDLMEDLPIKKHGLADFNKELLTEDTLTEFKEYPPVKKDVLADFKKELLAKYNSTEFKKYALAEHNLAKFKEHMLAKHAVIDVD